MLPPLNALCVGPTGETAVSENGTKASWIDVLTLYDSLQGQAWRRVRAFRDVVATLASAREVEGLTAVTSHEMLTISPYGRYPDWFSGRRITLLPLVDGTVRLERFTDASDSRAVETSTLPMGDVLRVVLDRVADL